MSHHWGIAGLVLNMAGALLLIWCPPTVRTYTREGSEQINFVNNPKPENRRRYLVRAWGFRVAIGTIVLGFLLQLIDLLTA
jgi:hypothetical protein